MDVECFLGTLNVFLSPKQVHLLIELCSGFSAPGLFLRLFRQTDGTDGHGQMDGQTDEQMEGWTNGQTDRQTETLIANFQVFFFGQTVSKSPGAHPFIIMKMSFTCFGSFPCKSNSFPFVEWFWHRFRTGFETETRSNSEMAYLTCLMNNQTVVPSVACKHEHVTKNMT